LLISFEPDRPWIVDQETNTRLVVVEDDLDDALEGFEIRLLDHPPNTGRMIQMRRNQVHLSADIEPIQELHPFPTWHGAHRCLHP
jgi:hypothetical protein